MTTFKQDEPEIKRIRAYEVGTAKLQAENKALKEKLDRWKKKLCDSGLIREKPNQMSEYNPCSQCGYDSSAYKALKESRDELLEAVSQSEMVLRNIGHKDKAKMLNPVIKRAEALKWKQTK